MKLPSLRPTATGAGLVVSLYKAKLEREMGVKLPLVIWPYIYFNWPGQEVSTQIGAKLVLKVNEEQRTLFIEAGPTLESQQTILRDPAIGGTPGKRVLLDVYHVELEGREQVPRRPSGVHQTTLKNGRTVTVADPGKVMSATGVYSYTVQSFITTT